MEMGSSIQTLPKCTAVEERSVKIFVLKGLHLQKGLRLSYGAIKPRNGT